MTDVFLERSFRPAIEPAHVIGMAVQGIDCFMLHRADWLGSLLATDGGRMVCWFQAPDAEAIRAAMRQASPKIDMPAEASTRGLWAGTVHRPASRPEPADNLTQVLVERQFEAPVTFESIQAMEDAGAWCLEAHDVQFLATFFAMDYKRMLCVYQAPDAEAVRLAQRQVGMPVASIWACRYVHPERTALPAG